MHHINGKDGTIEIEGCRSGCCQEYEKITDSSHAAGCPDLQSGSQGIGSHVFIYCITGSLSSQVRLSDSAIMNLAMM